MHTPTINGSIPGIAGHTFISAGSPTVDDVDPSTSLAFPNASAQILANGKSLNNQPHAADDPETAGRWLRIG